MYYEMCGVGDPLLLLHGGVAASAMLDPIVPLFAANRQVITLDLQAHGRTRDIDRPLRCETMADDVAAALANLGVELVDVLGYSMGGGVALQAAIRHPEVVGRLIVISSTMRRAASYPEVLAAFDRMTANAAQLGEQMRQSPLAERYPDVNWETVFAKIGDMVAQDYDWSADVAAIAAPTMLVFADADSIRPEHMVEFYGLLGGGQRDAGLDGSARPTARLAILPGATHYDILAHPALPALVTTFLDAPLPAAS
jgi:pimeloyl-ACP methyl ester carboxylesterase